MEKNKIGVICGPGRGKTSLAIGESLKASTKGQSVIIIQFLKGSDRGELDYLEELKDMDIKIFRFEKQESSFNELSEQEQLDEKTNILNGVNFARKVIVTRECDFLVLDEVLGLIEMGIISRETVTELLSLKDESMHIVLTGRRMPEWLTGCVDTVTTVTTTDLIDYRR